PPRGPNARAVGRPLKSCWKSASRRPFSEWCVTRPEPLRQQVSARELAPAKGRVHRRRAIESDLRDVGPGHVLGALTIVGGIPLAEVASALQLQFLATMQGNLGALGAALFGVGL